MKVLHFPSQQKRFDATVVSSVLKEFCSVFLNSFRNISGFDILGEEKYIFTVGYFLMSSQSQHTL